MNPLVSSGHLRNEKERKTSGTVTGDRRWGGGGGGWGRKRTINCPAHPHLVAIPETIAGHILLQFPLVSLIANSGELFLESRPYFLEVVRDPLCERLGVRFRRMASTGARHSLIWPKRVCR